MAPIELSGLTKAYGDFLAVDDVSFTVEDGEIFGYLGANGAGKTTTIRMLLGFLSPTAGTATVLGNDTTDEAALVNAKRRIGYVPDDPQFDEDSTGRAILDLHERLKGAPKREELLDLFDPPLDKQVRAYSHGNVKKLALVTTFMHDPDLVILDEPTSGLDPLMKQRFADFVRAERQQGLTVFFSSHILGEVRRLCDRVGILRQGQLATVEPIEALLDRSGKVVRVIARDSIERSAFADLAGVFDLQHGDKSEPNGPSGEDYREYTFTFTGDVDSLLRRLEQFELVDLTIEEAPLEDIFMRFYDETADGRTTARIEEPSRADGEGDNESTSPGDVDA